MEYIYDLLYCFMIYSVAGWCTEVIFATIRHGKFVNRGMLHGAYCPIYGFGLIIVIICLTPIKDSWVVLFVASAVLTTLLEFITGFVLDKIFHRRWWDYSNKKFNIKGYICPQFSVIWGAACVLILKVIQPAIIFAVEAIWKPLGVIILCLFYAMLTVDVILTFPEVKKLRNEIMIIDDLEKKLIAVSDMIGTAISGKTEQAIEFSKQHGIAPEDIRNDIIVKKNTVQAGIKQHTADEIKNIEKRLSDIKEKYRKNIAVKREDIESLTAEINEKLAELKSKNKRLYEAFPSLKSRIDKRKDSIKRKMKK